MGKGIVAALLVALALPAVAVARPLDLTDPDDLITVMRKIHCSTEDAHPIFFSWHGEAFSRRAGGNAYLGWSGRVEGNDWTMTITIPLFYHNLLGGDYQPYVGGAYHATEMFNFTGKLDDLTDPDTHTAKDVKVGWVRIAQWLPWMAMQGRDGLMYFHAASGKISGFDALPEILKDYINDEAPKYRAPPPVDDDRPNETSWSVFMKTIEGGRLPRGGAN